MLRKRSWPGEVIKLSRYFYTGTEEDHEKLVRLIEDTTARHRLQDTLYGIRNPADARLFYLLLNVQTRCGPTQPPVQWEVAFFPSDKAVGA